MDSTDREMMRGSLAAILDTGDGLRRARIAGAADRDAWARVVASGWLALMAPEDEGGIGGSPLDLVMLLEALARRLPPEPLGPALVASRLLDACAGAEAEQLAKAQKSGIGIALLMQPFAAPILGRPSHVLADAQWADHALMPDGEGASFRLLAVPLREQDIQRWPARTAMDGSSLLFLGRDPIAATTVAEGADAERATAQAQNLLRLCAAASLCGIGAQVMDDTVSFLKLRKQFGVPIGSFQALQHRAASMHVGSLAASALMREAALAVGTAEEEAACAMAKLKSSLVTGEIVRDGVQMHGAVGFSDELPLALQFRRAVTLANTYGAPDACRANVVLSMPRLSGADPV